MKRAQALQLSRSSLKSFNILILDYDLELVLELPIKLTWWWPNGFKCTKGGQVLFILE